VATAQSLKYHKNDYDAFAETNGHFQAAKYRAGSKKNYEGLGREDRRFDDSDDGEGPNQSDGSRTAQGGILELDMTYKFCRNFLRVWVSLI